MTECDIDSEDTHVMKPIGSRRPLSPVSEDDVATRVYRRPAFPTPVEWVEPPRRRSRRSREHTVTQTKPAFRYLVGMPVVPTRGGALPTVKRPAARSSAPLRKVLGAIALVSMALAALLALGSAPSAAASAGFVVVSASAGGSAPSAVRVFVDGEARCSSVPCELTLDPGEHYVSVVATGFEREPSREVVVAEGVERAVHFELAPRGEN